jgi:predicted MPP superfamily phosphohydrolase
MMFVMNILRQVPVLLRHSILGGRLQRQLLSSMGIMAGLGAGLTSYAYLMEPFDVRLERLDISLPGSEGFIPSSGLRLLHLSDSHFRGYDRRERNKIERVRRIAQDLEYDLLIHTGDFLHTDAGLPNVLDLIDALPQPRLGSYAVLGNHDYALYDMRRALRDSWYSFRTWEATRLNGRYEPEPTTHLSRTRRLLRFGRYLAVKGLNGKPIGFNNVSRLVAALEQKGLQILRNRSLHLKSGSKPGEKVDLHLAGIDDLIHGQPDLPGVITSTLAKRREAPLILLSHNPDVLLAPEAAQADLILAGHTHGGQIVLPMLGAAFTQAEYLSRREASGHLRRGQTQVYINRGLGEGIPLRLGAPPQLTLITLMPV